ncbi:hypothetical protein PMAYCL1PPCAC_19969, partial [Pristionchus mayeri]
SILVHLSTPSGPAGKIFVGPTAVDEEQMTNYALLFDVFWAMSKHADGDAQADVQALLMTALRQLSSIFIARWENVKTPGTIATACTVVCKNAKRDLYNGVEQETAEYLLDIFRRSDAYASKAGLAVMALMRALREKEETAGLRAVWTQLWNELNARARKCVLETSEDVSKLMEYLTAVEKCIPVGGKEAIEPEVTEIVELLNDKLKWAMGLLEIKKYRKPVESELKDVLHKLVICIVSITHDLLQEMATRSYLRMAAPPPPVAAIIKPLTDQFFTRPFWSITSPLRVATVLISVAPSHAHEHYGKAIWRLVITRAKGEAPEYTTLSGWTIEAMANSKCDKWYTMAFSLQSDFIGIIKNKNESRTDEVQTNTRENAIFCIVSLIEKYDARGGGEKKFRQIVEYLVKDWLPITVNTQFFMKVYTFIVQIAELGDQYIKQREHRVALLNIFDRALAKEGIWEEGVQMVKLRDGLNSAMITIGRKIMQETRPARGAERG